MDISKKKNGNKYLIFDSADHNKELLKRYKNVWNGIKNKIKEINVGKCHYEKPLKFHIMVIIIRSVFEKDGKLYLQVFLDDALYEV